MTYNNILQNMVNYQLAKIYKMESPSGLIYIGSTCEKTLARRLAGHKRNYKSFLDGKTNYISSFKLFEEDLENVNIFLVESFPCNSNDELHAREGHYIKQFECVNKRVAGRTKKEYYEDNEEHIAQYQKQYREQNKDKIAQQNKQYREHNKEQVSQQKKQHYEVNKDKISQQQKQYREQNKEQIAQQRKQYYQRIKQAKVNMKKAMDELEELEKEFDMI